MEHNTNTETITTTTYAVQLQTDVLGELTWWTTSDRDKATAEEAREAARALYSSRAWRVVRVTATVEVV